MNLSEKDQYIINQYQEDEEMMVLLYAQWCINHDVDPHILYEKAYPKQPKNKLLDEALTKTVDKEASEEIGTDLIIALLQAFGNDDLAFQLNQIAQKEDETKAE